MAFRSIFYVKSVTIWSLTNMISVFFCSLRRDVCNNTQSTKHIPVHRYTVKHPHSYLVYFSAVTYCITVYSKNTVYSYRKYKYSRSWCKKQQKRMNRRRLRTERQRGKQFSVSVLHRGTYDSIFTLQCWGVHIMGLGEDSVSHESPPTLLTWLCLFSKRICLCCWTWSGPLALASATSSQARCPGCLDCRTLVNDQQDSVIFKYHI